MVKSSTSRRGRRGVLRNHGIGIVKGSSQIGLNHAYALRVADGFEAGVSVEFCEDVLDVFIYGGGADVQLIRYLSSVVALCQTLQNFHFSRREPYVDVRRRQCLRPHKFTQRLFESFTELARPQR